MDEGRAEQDDSHRRQRTGTADDVESTFHALASLRSLSTPGAESHRLASSSQNNTEADGEVAPSTRRRIRPRGREISSPTTTARSPTSAYSADNNSTGLQYFYRSRTGSVDSRAEQLLSITQALGGDGGATSRIQPRSAACADTNRHTSTSSAGVEGSGDSPPAQASPDRSKASRANMSQVTDGGWSTGTGSSHMHSDDDRDSESFVSWNESEHGSLPGRHRRAKEDAVVANGNRKAGGTTGGGGRSGSATDRLLGQLGVGGVPSTSFDAPLVPRPNRNSKTVPPSAERARRLMDEVQRTVQTRRSQQTGLFGENGNSSSGSSMGSAVARALMDSLQDAGRDEDDSTADECYEDDVDDDEDADDGSSAEGSAHCRLSGRVGIAAHPTYPFSYLGEEDSRDRSQVVASDTSASRPTDIHEAATEVSSMQQATGSAREDVETSKQDENGSSKSSWISGSVSLEGDEDHIDDGLRERLGLGDSAVGKEEKEYDPFDLGSATTAGDSGPVKTPRWLQTEAHEQSQQQRREDNSSSPSSSSSGSSSSESYTSGSSSESSLPAEYVVAEPGWDKGSVAESSIKSITAQLRSTVQEEAIGEATVGAGNTKKAEKLPVYRRILQRIPSIQEVYDEPQSSKSRPLNSRVQEEDGGKGVYDPFDLRSLDGGDGEVQEPKRFPGRGPFCRSASSKHSAFSSSSSSSYTDASSSADTPPPAKMVVTKEDWAAGSVAESSIKSLTAHLRAKEASSPPEILPVYGKASASGRPASKSTKGRSSERASIAGTNKSASEPSLDPLYVAWGADATAENSESSHEGEENYQAWPDSPQKLRKCKPKPQPSDVDSIEKGWVIICINNIISSEKADEQERRAKEQSAIEREKTEFSDSDVVRENLIKREQANPNIVHEEQQDVGNLSAMWEAKANKSLDDPSKDASVVQSRKNAQDRIGSFRLRRNGAITLQSAWRSHCIRKKRLKRLRSAIIIQRAARTKLLAPAVEKKSACLVQSAYRSHVASRNFRSTVLACVKMQALVRGRLQRLETGRLKSHHAATVIQSWWRCQLSRQKEDTAACRIQSVWRRHATSVRYKDVVRRCVLIQAFARRVVAEREYHEQLTDVLLIQRAVRSWKATTVALETKEGAAAIILQSSFRSISAARSYDRQRAASIAIQTAYRGLVQTKRISAELQRESAATKIQSVFRAALATKTFENIKLSAVQIQSQTRGWMERARFARYLRLVRGCIALQAIARGAATRYGLDVHNNSARSIQRSWRAHIIHRHQRLEERKKKDAAAVVLQSSLRGMSTSRSYQRQKSSAILLQSALRMSVEKARYNNYLALVRGVVILQSISRRSSARHRYNEKRGAAVLLQSRFRSFRERDRFLRYAGLIRACIAFQALVRRFQARKTIAAKIGAANAIQQAWRRKKRMPPIQKGRLYNEVDGVCVSFISDNSDNSSNVQGNARATTEKLARYNSIDVSGSSSSMSRYLRIDSDLSEKAGGSEVESSGISDNHFPAPKCSSSQASYDEDRVTRALAMGVAACGASHVPSVETETSLEEEPGLMASDPSSTTSSVDDDISFDGYPEEGQTGQNAETSSIGSSHLSDYFDDELPPASRKVSSGQTAGDSSEASPKRKVNAMKPMSSGGSSSSKNSDPVGYVSTVLAPVAEESFEHNSESEVDLEANLDHRTTHIFPATTDLDERKLDCVVPSSHEKMESSVRARAEDLIRQNTLASAASSLMGSSSNLSSCFQDDDVLRSNKGQSEEANFDVSAAGQSTIQHEDKSSAKVRARTVGYSLHPHRASDVDIEQGLNRSNDSLSGGAGTSRDRLSYRKDSDIPTRSGIFHHDQARNLPDSSRNEISNMEEGFGGEGVSLIDNDDAARGQSARHPNNSQQLQPSIRQPPKQVSKPPRKPSRQPPRNAATLLPVHTEDTRYPPRSSDNKFVAFNRGHRCWCYIFGLVGLALIAGIVVAFTVDFSGNGSTNTSGFGASRNDSSPPTAVPSLAPTLTRYTQGGNYLRPTPAPSRRRPRPTPMSPIDPTRYHDFVSVVSQVSSERDIGNPASPQYHAIKWIATNNNGIEPESPYVVQRYILALLYFSTNGDAWSKCGIASPTCSDERAHFLSESSECLWYGVTCNDQGFIVSLELDRVGMDGVMPRELGSLSYLERLVLPRNQLSSTIPSSLSSLGNLMELDLFDNKVSGTIPTDFSRLPLKILQLSSNKLSGSIPTLNSDLEILDVSANDLDGTIPDDFFDATLLREVNLSMNRFSGTLGSDFGRLTELRKLLIGLNTFSGDVPASLGGLERLEIFHATYNDLTGSVPNEVCNLFDFRLKRLSTDCASPGSGRPAKITCSCCTLCLEGNNA